MLSLSIRRAIYIAFILGFLITAPLLLLYTAGYRYNFKRGEVQKVGSISIQPYPTSAEIYLDDKLQIGSRPDNTLRINNLLPGKYKIAIELADYYPWGKSVDVFSNVNTFVNRAVLFQKNTPKNILTGKITEGLLAPDGKNTAYLTPAELAILNLSNNQVTVLAEKPLAWKLAGWSKDSGNLLVKNGQNQFLVYNLNNPEQELLLNSLAPLNYLSVKWDPENDYLLYASTKTGFYQINILTRNYRQIFEFSLQNKNNYGQDFFYRNNALYYTYNSAGQWSVEKIDFNSTADKLNQETNAQKLLDLPSGNFSFRFNSNGTISLIDPSKQKLYLLAENFTKVIMTADAKDFIWSADGQRMLYYNDFEIWLYNLGSGNNELITRYGQLIQKVGFMPKVDYLAALVNGSLKIIELDGRDQRNIIELIPGAKADDFFIEPKGKKIFFNGQAGSEEGLFKLIIQE